MSSLTAILATFFLTLVACSDDQNDQRTPSRKEKDGNSNDANNGNGNTGNQDQNGDTQTGNDDNNGNTGTQPPQGSLDDFKGSRVFLPATLPAPAVILMHGSEGGRQIQYTEQDAQELAKAGFVAMSFCWFDCEGLPNKIYHIPLQRVLQAAAILKNSQHVQGKSVGLFGVSRGAEKAVLIGSLLTANDLFAAIATHAASDTVVASYDPQTDDTIMETHPQTGQQVFGAAWDWNGQLLYGENGSWSNPGPTIEIDKYPGPLYLSHGANDTLWPAQRSRNLESRRNARGGLVTETHFWPGEDHVIRNQNNYRQFISTLSSFFKQHLGN